MIRFRRILGLSDAVDDWVFNAVTTIIGVVGVTVALIAYFRPRKRLRLSYQTISTPYFAEDDYALPSELVMTFNGERVERLSKTTLIFWNSGTEVLKGEDIVRSEPLRICLDADDRILSHQVAGVSKKTNQVQVDRTEGAFNELSLRYDYLDPRDGLVLEIMHNSKRRRPVIRGAVKGLANGPDSQGTAGTEQILALSTKMLLPPPLQRRVVQSAAVIGGAAFLAGAAAAGIQLVSEPSQTWLSSVVDISQRIWPEPAILMMSIGGAYFLPMGLLIWATKRRYPKSLATYLRPRNDQDD